EAGDESGTEAGDESGTEAGDESGTEEGVEDGTEDGTEDGDEDGVEYDPSISVEPGIVTPGDDVTVEGEGFVPDSTVTVVITDEDGDVIDTIEGVETDSDGGFSIDWTVPEGTQPGELTVTATDDEDSDVTASETVTVVDADGTEAGDESGTEDGVEYDPSISVEPGTVTPGDDVTVEGEGFVPDSTVTVVITDEDGDVIDTIEGVETDSDGGFSIDWTVPEGTQPGELTVTATDDTDPSVSASETVTIAEPAAAGEDGTGTVDPGTGAEDGAGKPGDGKPGDDLASTGVSGAIGLGLMALLLVVVGSGVVAFAKVRRTS
ncbi:hypothetical protein SD455_08435, partial [Nesterenkonia sp. K-15-9-6]